MILSLRSNHRNLVLAILFLFASLQSGCSKKTELSSNQEDVNFSDSSILFSAPLPAQPKHLTGNTVIVRVDEEEITYADIQKEIDTLLLSSGTANLPPERQQQVRSRMADQAMQNVIVKQLLLEAIEKENILAKPEELDQQTALVTSRLKEGTTLSEVLAQNQITDEEFRNDLELSIRVQKLLDIKTAGLAEPTPQQIEDFYKQNREQFTRPESVQLRHLLILVNDNADTSTQTQAREKAEDLRQQILNGADFGQMAQQHSDDTPSRERGGLLKNVQRGFLPKPLDDAAFSIGPGQLSNVLETELGYHILLVEKMEPEVKPNLADVADQIDLQLRELNKKRKLNTYITSLKNKAVITFPQPIEPSKTPAQ